MDEVALIVKRAQEVTIVILNDESFVLKQDQSLIPSFPFGFVFRGVGKDNAPRNFMPDSV